MYMSSTSSKEGRQNFLKLRIKWQWTESDQIQSVTFSDKIFSSVCISSSSTATEWATEALHHSLFSCFLLLQCRTIFQFVCFKEGSWCTSGNIILGLNFLTFSVVLFSFFSTSIPIFVSLPNFSTPHPLYPFILIILSPYLSPPRFLLWPYLWQKGITWRC